MGLFKRREIIKDAAAIGKAAMKMAEGAAGFDPIAAAAGAEDGDEEIAVVIAAAIAAYEAEQYRQTLNIRKLDRTAGTRPAWGVAGMQEAIDMRRM